MKRFFLSFILIALVSLVSVSFKTPAYHTITVKVTNIRNSTGNIQLQIFRSAENYNKGLAWKIKTVDKSEMKNNTITCTFTGIESGEYGMALLDDENKNKEMDYTMLMPDEGFGFADYYHTSWSKPKYDSFKFSLKEDKAVTVKVRYV
ncbi:DUF2141 domain-containing protein [Fluviicola taffensis]|uniref:DUF2141 domain-containing protein n=1 Tax=Fluviicola taffensis (strain DSM 16823 / NCIMB 13979 / RW262) TaxID=755732 RepID=F2IIK3_FLUTR|nr:DUF2141 domain-containing protein [Fluviicola taffensis]AEA45965.1 Protein of unknown function DUF2141 [Fluviicola taffensis DSM 16823]